MTLKKFLKSPKGKKFKESENFIAIGSDSNNEEVISIINTYPIEATTFVSGLMYEVYKAIMKKFDKKAATSCLIATVHSMIHVISENEDLSKEEILDEINKLFK